MIRRFLAVLLAIAVFTVTAPPDAFAQSDTGEIDIVVTDAATKAPVVLARVILDGPVIASEFTGSNGKVRFTDVPDGIYRARVAARGYQSVTSDNFEIVNGRTIAVNVALAQSTGPLKIIGSVEAKSTATVSTSSINNESAQRKLSNDLADALGKLSGVNVTTSSNDSDSTQTISLEGQDASQTALTVDGIPLNAPGTAGDMRMISSDLFTGSSVHFGPQVGGLAGGVNFSTLSPTLSWQSAFSLSAGSNGKNNYSAAESGSLGKLGIAAMYTYRAVPSLLDGLIYQDASGLTYDHQGDRDQKGSLLKLRYQLTEAQTLTGMFLSSTNNAEEVCTQYTGPVPCGYGPGNYRDGMFDLYSLTDNALVGETQVQAAFFGSRSTNTNDQLNRYIDGIAAPTGTTTNSGSAGFSVNATLPARDRHTISISAYDTNSSNTYTPLVPAAIPYTFGGQSASYGAIQINDSIRSNTKLKLNESIGFSHATNAPSSVLGDIGVQWQPTTNDSYAFAYNVGGVAGHVGRYGLLTDPANLRFDCNGKIAYGTAPGDQPGASSSNSARLSYTHTTRRGLISAQIYRQNQNDVVLPVDVNGQALLPYGIFPPDYFNLVNQIYNSPAGCGTTAESFGPQNTYFSTAIAGVSRVYEGAQITGFFTLGNLVVEPFYNVQVAKALSNDPRFVNPYAITISGNQLPNVPLHRAGITVDYRAPHSVLEYLADANYTGSNNSQNLPAYTTIDAGVSANLTRGTLTVAATNITNAYAGIFATPENAVPYTTAGGEVIPTVARPNTPRQYSVTYTVRFGAGAQQSNNRAAGGGLGNRGGGPSPEGGGPGGPGGERRSGGFRQLLQPLPSAPPADPFALSQSQLCNAQAQQVARPILDGLKAYVARIEAAKTPAGYPDTFAPASIPGLGVTYHGMKQTYALTLAVKQGSNLRGLFGCSQLHIAQADEVQKRGLYLEPSAGAFFRPAVNFMPAVGLYFVRQQPRAGAENFRVYKLPATKPAAPFAMRTASDTCTAEMKSTAAELLGELQKHFAGSGATPNWTIVPHPATSGTWYSLDPSDIGAIPALINCARVAAATKDELVKAGWDGATPPTLNYAPALGLYIVNRMTGGPGTGRGGEGAGPQSPAPSPSPSASPPPKT